MMNNTTITTEICSDNFNYNNALHISYIVWRSCGLLCALFGIPGHCFHILITLKKSNRKQTTSLHFMAIAICELTFLLGITWLWAVSMSIIKTDPRQIMSCGIFYSIIIGSTILSNLYLASMSVDRSFMVLYPTRSRLIITRRHVSLRLVLILIIVILFMIPHHFYYYYDPKSTIFICEFYSFINRWKIHLWPFLHAIVFVSLPSVISCISSAILLHNRCHHRQKSKNKLSLIARRMERNSVATLCISISILFFLLPTVILQIFIVHDRLFHHEILCSTRWKIYKILLNWFLTLSSLNYSLKFYIRLSISRSFQRDFIQIISCNFIRTKKNNEQRLSSALIHQNEHFIKRQSLDQKA